MRELERIAQQLMLQNMQDAREHRNCREHTLASEHIAIASFLYTHYAGYCPDIYNSLNRISNGLDTITSLVSIAQKHE